MRAPSGAAGPPRLLSALPCFLWRIEINLPPAPELKSWPNRSQFAHGHRMESDTAATYGQTAGHRGSADPAAHIIPPLPDEYARRVL